MRLFHPTAIACTVVGKPVAILVAGPGAVTAHRVARPGRVQPVAEILKTVRTLKPLIGLLCAFAIALPIAWMNVYFAARIRRRLDAAAGGHENAA